MARDLSTRPAPPGWYADPGGTVDQRYWDGAHWTQGAVVDGVVAERPLPLVPPPDDLRAVLPAAAAGWGLLGWVVGMVGATVGLIGSRAVTDNLLVHLLASQTLLWAGLMGAVLIDSRRYGSGRIRRDYQLCLRGKDVALGVSLSLVARVAAGGVAVLVLLLTNEDVDALPSQVDAYERSTAALVAVVIIAVFAAPVVEELFFRGLLMRSLEPSLKPAGAIAVQAVLFGAVHVSDVGWRQNVAIMSSLAVTGAILGVLVFATKRLGPAIWLHATFNGIAAVVIVAQHV